MPLCRPFKTITRAAPLSAVKRSRTELGCDLRSILCAVRLARGVGPCGFMPCIATVHC